MKGHVTKEIALCSIRECFYLPNARATATSTDADDARPTFQGKSLMVITVISSPGTTPGTDWCCTDDNGVAEDVDLIFFCIIACTTPCQWYSSRSPDGVSVSLSTGCDGGRHTVT